jgi:hypothetical protein
VLNRLWKLVNDRLNYLLSSSRTTDLALSLCGLGR